jgi:hypothetical protein
MAIVEEIKKQIEKGKKFKTQIVPQVNDPNYTKKDEAIMGLATKVVLGVLLLIFVLVIGLFVLIALGNKDASTFKDIVSTFIAVASGLLGSILGYYYKNND